MWARSCREWPSKLHSMTIDNIAALKAELESVEKEMKATNEAHKARWGTTKDVHEHDYFRELDKRHRELLAELAAARGGQTGQ